MSISPYEYIVNVSRDFITLINRDYVYEIVNDSYCRAIEKTRDLVLGKTVAEVWGDEVFEKEIKHHLDDCLAGREVQYIDKFKFGPFEKHMHINCYPYVSEDGRITHALIFSHDITHISQIESKLSHYEYRDPLTGLFNRRSLDIILDKELEKARRTAGALRAVVFIELENMGRVNQVYGHAVGDVLLENTGLRIKKSLRNSDFVFRFDGYQLTCLLTHIAQSTDAATVAQKISQAVGMPYHHKEGDITIGSSVGVSVFPNDGDTPDTLIQNASSAMEESKHRGADYVLYNADLQEQAVHRMSLESEMGRAFEKKQYMLTFQPIVDLTGRIKGAEALMRWNHPEKGWIPPLEFIPLAEETGIIQSIGKWALFTASEHLARWSQFGIFISINLSATDFCDDDLPDVLRGALDRAGGLSPQFLKLEVTESQVMLDPEDTIRRMNRLSAAGFDLFIDDFGTGRSSLGYLKRLPAGTIKIDRVFVDEAMDSPEDFEYLRNIVALARSRRKAVLLEGIGNAQQYELLCKTDVDSMQGFYFSRPIEADHFEDILASGGTLPV